MKAKNNKRISKKEKRQIVYIVLAVAILIVLVFMLLKKNNNDYVYDYYYSYTANDWYNVLLRINHRIPSGITTYSTKEEAIAAFPKNDLSVKPFLIMHRMYKDTIIESYILFNKDGKYYRIRGGYKVNNLSNDELLEIESENKKVLMTAFGKDSCDILDNAYYCYSDYDLAEGKWTLKVENDGRVRAAGYDAFCVIDKNGGSGCGVTP